MSSKKASSSFLSQGQNLKLERPQVETAIEGLYKTVKEMPVILLDDENIENLSTQVYDLELPGQNSESSALKQLSFFQPMSEEDYSRYTLSEKDNERHLKSFQRFFDNPQYLAILTADNLFLILAHLVDTAHRDGIPLSKYGSKQSLGSFTGWFWQEGFCEPGMDSDDDETMSDNSEDSRGMGPLCIQACYWKRYSGADEEKKTHFMLALKLDCENVEELLRVEVLEILEVMKGRLKEPGLEKQVIFPAMVFSFMGRRARIIQAYHDGTDLIICKSCLFEFRDAATAPVDLFIRYIANKPIGETRPLAEQTSSQAVDSAIQPTNGTNGRALQPVSVNQDKKTLKRRPSRLDWAKGKAKSACEHTKGLKTTLSIRKKKENRPDVRGIQWEQAQGQKDSSVGMLCDCYLLFLCQFEQTDLDT